MNASRSAKQKMPQSRQVQALCPESTDCTDRTSIHTIAQYPQQQGRHNFRGRGAFRGGRHGPRGGLGGAQSQRYRCSTDAVWKLWFQPHKSREKCRALNQECFHCRRLEHFSNMCRQNTDNQYSDNTEVKHIDTEEQSPDHAQSEYTTPYYLTNDQVKASVKCLKTTAKVHHMHYRDIEHMRLLWVAQFQGSQVSQTDSKVNTGAGCNILPTHRAQQLFGQEWLRTLDLPRVQIKAYGGQSVHSLNLMCLAPACW